MNPRIEKISAEIEKVKAKLSSHQARLRELERQKTEFENADILAMVRGMDVAPDEFAAFVRMFKAQQAKQAGALPDLEALATGEADADTGTGSGTDTGTGNETDTALQDDGGGNSDNHSGNATNLETDKEDIQQ